MATQKENLDDFLAPRRSQGELWWSLRTREGIPEYKYANKITSEGIKKQVLNSPRIENEIKEMCVATGQDEGELLKETKAMLDEMGHTSSMGSVRFLAYVLPKVFKSIFRNIYVNTDGIEKIRKTVKDTPVVFLPTHRSYIDFIIMSYICFHYDLPMPCIAAGQDFMFMKFVGKLLRNCGAFYMRRSFGKDRLYWAVFTEYVQLLIRHGDYPVEFFLEGTRSRTAKSLPPKLGNLSGLFKARTILNEDYGRFYVHFSEPLSLRRFSEGHVNRSKHNLSPRFKFSLTEEEQEFVHGFAHTLILQQQKYLVAPVWSLISTLLLMNHGEMTLELLYQDLQWLYEQISGFGFYVDWPAHQPIQAIIHSCLSVHHNVASVTKDGRLVVNLDVDGTNHRKTTNIEEMTQQEIMNMATVYIVLGHYRNQITHVFVRMALVSLCLGSRISCFKDQLFTEYSYLVKIMSSEFIFHPKLAEQDFNGVLRKFQSNGIISITGNEITRQPNGEKLLTFLQQMFHPFLIGYWVMCQYLLSINQTNGGGQHLKEITLTRGSQSMVAEMIRTGDIAVFDSLSLNLLSNTMNSLVNLEAVKKIKRNKEILLLPLSGEILKISDRISDLVEVPLLRAVHSRLHSVIPSEMKAKL
ncbi:dihydroxyacetone phosphate acyltransferase-like [Saccoglossus kowalevskii]|uniref:Dihydroxyacetone phosphate acyltransferase-like n=1 Tax=Saccoglossus kowalevskii TaxID=10224 RepID=A0ABM0MZ39_SACKO|nr:PREDICTED: dihydroxyacetone phosphate acyltransferase-like [Saccoglossus kowalevskii]